MPYKRPTKYSRAAKRLHDGQVLLALCFAIYHAVNVLYHVVWHNIILWGSVAWALFLALAVICGRRAMRRHGAL